MANAQQPVNRPPNAAQTVAAVLTADGAGSGLDADLVRGEPPVTMLKSSRGIPRNGARVPIFLPPGSVVAATVLLGV